MRKEKTNIPTDITALAREYGEAAIQVLVEIMTDPDAPASTRLSAAKAILERGWGKPPAQAKEQPRAAPINRVEWAIVDHRPPENRPEPQDTSVHFASHSYGQSAHAPVQAHHDRQPGDGRLAQPP